MSQNDRNDGPPDLDQIIRNLGKRLSTFFGGGNGSSPEKPASLNPAAPAHATTMALIIVSAIVVLWGASGFFVVDEREDAVIMRFGRYTQTVENSGLHWRLPWPVETHEIVNMTEIRSLEVGSKVSTGKAGDESIMLTGDQNIIEVQLEVQYNFKSAYDYVFNNRSTERDGRDIVKQTAETAIREVIGRNKVDYVLNEGRGKVAEDSKELIQELLNKYGMGIAVSRVNISDIQPPDQVQAAFSDAVKGRQDRARLINEGRAYANDVIPKASGTAARLTQEAEGYRQRVISQAEGDASRFRQVYTEYAKAPQVTRDRMYLDAMQQVYQSTTKVLVDQKAGGNLLYLPLDKLIQMTNPGQSATADAAVKPEAPTQAAPEVPASARSGRSAARDGR